MRDISFKTRGNTFLLACAVVFVFFCLASLSSQSREERQRYDRLPSDAKVATEVLVDTVAQGARGDFLIFRDGRVAILYIAGKSEYGLEVRIKTHPGGHVDSLLFEKWMVRRDLDRLVRRSDPEAGEVALKFLAQ